MTRSRPHWRTPRAQVVKVDLNDGLLPQPRLTLSGPTTAVRVPAYTDFKLHDISDPEDKEWMEPIDMNLAPWSLKFASGNRKFLTKRLWGCANEPPYFHHGMFTTMRQAVLAHAGEALESRRAFQRLSTYEQDTVIEFLKTLQVLPPGTKELVVDENYRPKRWPPLVVTRR